jgi:hypothetical protein
VKQNWFINKFEYYDKKYQQAVESNDKYKVTSESFDEYKKEKGSLPHNYDETKGTTPKQK